MISVCDSIVHVMDTCADRIAVSGQEQELTYRQLQGLVASIQNALRDETASTAGAVVLLAARGPHVIASLVGMIAAGRLVVPLDPEQPVLRLAGHVRLAAPAAVLYDDPTEEVVHALRLPAQVKLLNLDRIFPSYGLPVTVRAPGPGEGSYLYFTSGSTGEPKCIKGQLKGLSHFVSWEVAELSLRSDVRTSQLTSPAFDAILRDIFVPLSVGGAVCLPPSRRIVADGPALARWLASSGVTVLHTMPSVLRRALQAMRTDRSAALPRLSTVCVAGEVLLPSDVELFYQVMPEEVALLNLYGPTETTMVKLFHRVAPTDAGRASVPLGKAMPGARVLVMDSRLKPCASGMVGEICIRTPYRSLGYLNRPDLDAEAFVANPLNNDPGDLIYRTGDLGRTLDSGDIEFVGRRDRQVKIQGVRIELAEVEAIYMACQAVLDVAVVSSARTEGELELVAYVVVVPGTDPDEIRQFVLRRGLPAMVSGRLLAVDVLPRTTSGKVDYAALRELEKRQVEQEHVDVPPTTPLELALANLWSELLDGEPVNSIDAHFFAIGGHSLLAMQLLSRVEAAYGVNVSIRIFLENPTIRTIAQQVESLMLVPSADEDLLSLFDEHRR